MELEKATFAGGCFWCVEAAFEKIPGVRDVVSGYTGGKKANPTYEEVSSGNTGHFEAIEITFDPIKVSFVQLLERFWREINPTDAEGQFADRGTQYRTAIFYHTESQKKIAEESKVKMEVSGIFGGPIVTLILPAMIFYPAEEYHQNYCVRNPTQYKFYRHSSGRDSYLDGVWKNSEANPVKRFLNMSK